MKIQSEHPFRSLSLSLPQAYAANIWPIRGQRSPAVRHPARATLPTSRGFQDESRKQSVSSVYERFRRATGSVKMSAKIVERDADKNVCREAMIKKNLRCNNGNSVQPGHALRCLKHSLPWIREKVPLQTLGICRRCRRALYKVYSF